MEEESVEAAEVIWYNDRKGFGFVTIGEDEVFLHRSALDRFGLISVYTNDLLKVTTTVNEKGPVVKDIVGIERNQQLPDEAPAELEGAEVSGIVKFFNPVKGYGFVEQGDDMRDVFVHLRTLRSCGIHNLFEGQRLLMNVTDDGRGPQARLVRLLQQ